MLENAFQELAK